MLVSEVMTTTPVTIRADASVHEAIAALAEHHVTSLPVVDGSGRLQGVLSEADAIRERVLPDARAHAIPPSSTTPPADLVADVMTPMPVSVGPDTDLAHAVDLLTSTSAKSLPVVDRRRRLVGVVSRSDVVRALSRSDDEVRADVERLLGASGHDDWLVDAHEGSVVVEGPHGEGEAALARAVARAVPGVVAAHVEPGDAVAPATTDTDLGPAGHQLLQLACRAPSVHNTQPWLWRSTGRTIELYADPSRKLPASDPDGRNMLISCGAALHHLQVAARGLGLRCTVERLPSGAGSTLLARVSLEPLGARGTGGTAGSAADAEERARDLEAITARVTDRRRFTTWPVPEARLDHLASVGTREGCTVLTVADGGRRHRVEELVEQARGLQSDDPRLRAERDSWVLHSRHDGVPESALEGPATRFDDVPVVDPGGIERADGVLVLATPTDEPLDHLRTGEALSRLWLTATTGLLSVVPLSQVVEEAQTRQSLQQDVLGNALVPQLLVRVGWQESSRGRLPPSPRRPLVDVLLP